MTCLRAAKDGSEALDKDQTRACEIRKEMIYAHKSKNAPRERNAVSRRQLQDSEETLDRQRENQNQRETDLLEVYGYQVLINCGYLFVPRRASDLSSSSGVVPFSLRLPNLWSEKQGPLPTFDDGVQQKTEALESWRDKRADVLLQHKHVENNRKAYMDELGDHFYMYPNSTQAQLDTMVEQRLGWDRHENERIERATLERLEKEYLKIRDQARRDRVQDRPLSEDWAASVCDVFPSQGESLIYQIENTDADARAQRIRRWNRQTARRRPFGADGGLQPSPRFSPAVRALRPRSFGRASSGVLSSCLSPRTRRRRVRRMSAIARHLRQQFMEKSGLIFEPDPKRTA